MRKLQVLQMSRGDHNACCVWNSISGLPAPFVRNCLGDKHRLVTKQWCHTIVLNKWTKKAICATFQLGHKTLFKKFWPWDFSKPFIILCFDSSLHGPWFKTVQPNLIFNVSCEIGLFTSEEWSVNTWPTDCFQTLNTIEKDPTVEDESRNMAKHRGITEEWTWVRRKEEREVRRQKRRKSNVWFQEEFKNGFWEKSTSPYMFTRSLRRQVNLFGE